MPGLLQPFELTETGRWVFLGWCFVLGSCIGSFLNVVAYRLPRSMSLNRPPSTCPNCRKRIRWHDNVPILGWLWLRGRCRDCGAPISARYPLVEFLVGAATALLAASSIEPLTPAMPAGFAFAATPIVVGIRLFVLYVLATTALLEFDAARPPLRLLQLAVITAIVFQGLAYFAPEGLPADAIKLSVRGAVTALLLGALVWPSLVGDGSETNTVRAACGVLSLLLVGITFGWQATCGIGLLAALAMVLARLGSRLWPALARSSWPLWLIAGTLVWLTLAPRVLPNCEPRPLGVVFVTGMFVAALALLGRAVGGQQARRSLLSGG